MSKSTLKLTLTIGRKVIQRTLVLQEPVPANLIDTFKKIRANPVCAIENPQGSPAQILLSPK